MMAARSIPTTHGIKSLDAHMVERVARAIDPDLWAFIDSDRYQWIDRHEPKERSLMRARAAIDAMRK